jgi:hypothetical protein
VKRDRTRPFFCVEFNDSVSISDCIASNDAMIDEQAQLIGKNAEGSGRSLIEVTILAFVWMDRGNPRRTQ